MASPTGLTASIAWVLAIGFAAWASSLASGLRWWAGGLAAFLFVLGVAAAWPALRRHVLVRVGPDGVFARGLRRQTIAWNELEAVGEGTLHGRVWVDLTLRRGAPSLTRTARWRWPRVRVRRLTLDALRRRDRLRVAPEIEAGWAVHGSGPPALTAHQEAERQSDAFMRRLQALTPVPWALYAVVAANVGVWVASLALGLDAFSPRAQDLFAWGANSAWAVLRENQPWRLLTATFLHGGFLHLALNMLGLCGAGLLLNRLHGNAQFLLIYLGSALVGSGVSLHFSSQQSVSVGASGAVFGVLGALLVCFVKHLDQVPALLSRRVLTSQGVFVAYALAQGFGNSRVDNAAHVGGLLAGAVLAVLLVEKVGPRRPRELRAVMAGMAVVAAVGVLVSTSPAPRIDHAAGFRAEEVVTRESAGMQKAQAAYQRDLSAYLDQSMGGAELARAIRERHIPVFRGIESRFATVKLPSSDPRAALVEDLQRVPGLIVRGMEIDLARIEKRVDPMQGQAQAVVLRRDLDLLNARLKRESEALQKKSR